ncbi:beta-amylase 1, chloroplastic-like [Andrographis paniculata]|uniref:beta-amylase 1, chloroplastic-like n=1 Tax=Andrographis paniculata TaxID=175694 RepID=UPI0021E739F8|nr:beta-amylase 1, chloroplastic-like [Andrographis paniculata]
MAIASPSAPRFCCTDPARRSFSQPVSARFGSGPRSRVPTRPRIACRLNSSSSSASSDGEAVYELNYHSRGRRRGSFPVYVTLPADAVGPAAETMRRRKAMAQSFRALAAAGVEGVVMEVWWGLVEQEFPTRYNWKGYLELVEMAKRFGLKVRAAMAFHQSGTGPGDPLWIPLPRWVLEEIDKDPDVAYADRFGRRNTEYISLGCDILPILCGRSPIQAYADFMRNFRDTFRSFLGGTITGIQVGLGPGGELRYPSCPTQKLSWGWRVRELGEFQCYDKYMLASLNACTRETGIREWGAGGPFGTGSLMQNLEDTEFFQTDGSWRSPYGEFFLGWYSGMLLLHGERICREAEMIFRGNEVNMSGKVSGVHWHYGTRSHPSELTSGYYNTSIRDGFVSIVRMFGRYGFTVCCPCFEMQDVEEQQTIPTSLPESFVRQLMRAARICDVPLEGENYSMNLDDESFQQVLKMSRLYSDGQETPSFSFNFVRMDKNMFEPRSWVSFTRFVREMSVLQGGGGSGGADSGGGETNFSSRSASAAFAGAAVAY